ncbi:MAG TPA: DUF5686 family protein [Rhodothermales bacterium]|nr:DUF5686 family protein [Rhodothermales bacterium]
MRLLIWLAVVVLAVPAHAQVVVRGSVTDAKSGAPLPGANIIVDGTASRTETDPQGRFVLQVPSLPVTLVVSYVGYERARIVVERSAETVAIRLQPATVELSGVVVEGQEFAANLMRKVIAEKQRWRAHLRTYAADGYTKTVLKHGGNIVFVSQSGFDVFWDRERGPREVVRALRKTGDLGRLLPIQESGFVPNLYDDTVPVQGLDLIGPTHPGALSYYNFSLADRREVDGHVVYDLYVAPKDEVHATFVGNVSIREDASAMVRADLRPAAHVTFPAPVESWHVAYVEEFERADSAWLPAELERTGPFSVYADDVHTRSGMLEQLTYVRNARTNVALPEAPYATDIRVSVDSASVWSDYLFLAGRDVIPLSPLEAEALEQLIHHPLTLAEAFPPERQSGFLAVFLQADMNGRAYLTWPELLGYQFRFRYNRVDGLLSSVGQVMHLSPDLEIDWRLAQATGLSRVRYRIGVRYRISPGLYVNGSRARDTDALQHDSVYPLSLTSVPFLFGAPDYFDYYWLRRSRLEAGYLFPAARAVVGFSIERHDSLSREVGRALLLGNRPRPNPAIQPGRLHALDVAAILGEGRRPPPEYGVRRAIVQAEYGARFMGSDFTYGRLGFGLDVQVPTFFRSRPRPNTLDVHVSAHFSRGNLPPQRLAVLDGSPGHFDGSGAFRALGNRPVQGEQALAIFWQHDFKTIPFEALGLWPLVRMGMGLALYGGHGRTWTDPDHARSLPYAPIYQDAFHHELGLSLTNVLGTPLRLDFTYQLERPEFFIGFGVRNPFSR